RADLEMVTEFARHYDVTLVTCAPLAEDDELGAAFPTISESDFMSRGAHFDRIVYRVGGSEASILGDLLSIFPGAVVLRDDGLVDAALVANQWGRDRDSIARVLFDNHGWRAIDALHRNLLDDNLPLFPSLFR